MQLLTIYNSLCTDTSKYNDIFKRVTCIRVKANAIIVHAFVSAFQRPCVSQGFCQLCDECCCHCYQHTKMKHFNPLSWGFQVYESGRDSCHHHHHQTHKTQTNFRLLYKVRQWTCVYKASLGFGLVYGYCVTVPHSVLVLARHK